MSFKNNGPGEGCCDPDLCGCSTSTRFTANQFAWTGFTLPAFGADDQAVFLDDISAYVNIPGGFGSIAVAQHADSYGNDFQDPCQFFWSGYHTETITETVVVAGVSIDKDFYFNLWIEASLQFAKEISGSDFRADLQIVITHRFGEVPESGIVEKTDSHGNMTGYNTLSGGSDTVREERVETFSAALTQSARFACCDVSLLFDPLAMSASGDTAFVRNSDGNNVTGVGLKIVDSGTTLDGSDLTLSRNC